MFSTRQERSAAFHKKNEIDWEEHWWETMKEMIHEFNILNYDYLLSQSPYVTKERVEKTMDVFLWDYSQLYANNIIDDEFKRKHGIVTEYAFDKIKFEDITKPKYQTFHPSDITALIDVSEIDAHFDEYDWCYCTLKSNSSLTLDFVVKWFELKGIPFDSIVMRNIRVTLADIKKHEEFWLYHIDWPTYLKYNDHVSKDIVYEYFEIICKVMNGWPVHTIYKYMTFEMFLRYVGITDTLLDYKYLSRKMKNDYFKDFVNVKLKDSQFKLFQEKGDVNLDIIKKYPEVNWDIYLLRLNKNNTYEIFKEYEGTDVLNGESYLACCSNLTFEMLLKNKDWLNSKWIQSRHLLRKSYDYERQTHLIKQARKHMAAYKIQQWWNEITTNPYHPVGIRRLERKYAEDFPKN